MDYKPGMKYIYTTYIGICFIDSYSTRNFSMDNFDGVTKSISHNICNVKEVMLNFKVKVFKVKIFKITVLEVKVRGLTSRSECLIHHNDPK